MRVGFSLAKVDLGCIGSRASRARERARTMMTLAAIGDTRPYVPKLSGALVASGDKASQPSRGLIIYDTEYARAQYYGLPNKTRQHHPQATKQWFEPSKAANKRRWQQVASSEYRKELRG